METYLRDDQGTFRLDWCRVGFDSRESFVNYFIFSCFEIYVAQTTEVNASGDGVHLQRVQANSESQVTESLALCGQGGISSGVVDPNLIHQRARVRRAGVALKCDCADA